MSRHYDDAQGRGSRSADPSIDAWFRELRGDPGGRSGAAPARTGSATRSRQQHHRVDPSYEDDWFRQEQARRGSGHAPADSWSVDTRAWAPSWDNASTGYVARQSPRQSPNTLKVIVPEVN